jgi:hypothetical protein
MVRSSPDVGINDSCGFEFFALGIKSFLERGRTRFMKSGMNDESTFAH